MQTVPHRPVFPETKIEVRPWNDPLLDQLGHDPRSNYVERYWTSILGPSSTLLIRKISASLCLEPDGFAVDPVMWAQELGIGMKGGKNGPLWRAIDRSCRFGAAKRHGPILAVRRKLPPLSARQVERLPTHLQAAHKAWTEEQLLKPRRQSISKWNHQATPITPDAA